MENREKNSGFGVASYVLGFSGSISMLVVQYMAIISVIRGNFTDVRLELIGIFALALVIVLFSSLILGRILSHSWAISEMLLFIKNYRLQFYAFCGKISMRKQRKLFFPQSKGLKRLNLTTF